MKSPAQTLDSGQSAAAGAAEKEVFVFAGAGSGKTRVLTARYLDALLSGDAEVGEIVAVTFTEKAAAEMKRRVRETARALLAGEKDAEKRARLQRLLRELSSAKISTLHSLASSLLRTFPAEARCDPDFEVRDEGLDRIAIERAANRFMLEKLETDDTGASFLVDQYGIGAAEEMLVSLYSARAAATLWLERWRDAPDETFAAAEKASTQARLRAAADFAGSAELRRIEAKLRDIDALGLGKSPGKGVSECLALIADLRRDPGDYSVIAALKKVQWGRTSKEWADYFDDARGAIKRIRGEIDARRLIKSDGRPAIEEFGRADVKAKDVIECLARMYPKFSKVIEDGGRVEGALNFEDMLLSARALLSGSKYARAEASRAVKTVLVDEFQDTDPVQAEIVSHISSGGFFAVGDAKQSIYRFRGADVSVFNRRAGEVAKGAGNSYPLDVNYRSTPELIAFFNYCFEQVFPDTGTARDFEAAHETAAAHRRKGFSPAVEVLRPAIETSEGAKKVSAQEERRTEAAAIAAWIDDTVSSGKKLIHEGEKARAARYGDIAILLRSFSDLPVYEKALAERGIDYHVSGGSTFYRRQEVTDLTNFLKTLYYPEDAAALFGLLRGPFFDLSDDSIVLMKLATGGLLPSAEEIEAVELPAGEKKKAAAASRLIGELRARADRMPISQLVEEMIDRTDFATKLLLSYGGRRKYLNLRKYIELARDAERSGAAGIGDFIELVREKTVNEYHESEAAAADEGAGAVRVLTVHKAKGLEFGVVIAADLGRRLRRARLSNLIVDGECGIAVKAAADGEDDGGKTSGGLYSHLEYRDFEREAAEDKRLLYVTMTRATDYLALSTAQQPTGGSAAGMLNDIIGFEEREEGIFEAAPGVPIRLTRRIDIPEPADAFRVAGIEKITASETRAVKEKVAPACVRPVAPEVSGGAVFTAKEDFIAYARCPRRFTFANLYGFRALAEAQSRTARKPGGMSALEYGSFVHEFFEEVDFEARDINAENERASGHVLEKYYARDDEAGRGELSKRLRAAWDGFVKSAALPGGLASCKFEKELPFMMTLSGGAAVEGVIDLLAIDGDGNASVIDYKTDAVPDGAAEVLAHYRPQLEVYAAAAADYPGVTRVKAGLYLVATGEVAWLGDYGGKELKALKADIASRAGVMASAPLSANGSCTACGYGHICEALADGFSFADAARIADKEGAP